MEINFPQKEEEILKFWQKNKIFEKSIEQRKKEKDFVFYEGPPTANGKPGIHHVLSRTFKDIICRYKTMQGLRVLRKAGWDTHGLPVELQVEKELGLKNKKEIEKFGIGKFNKFCRQSVWSYKKDWEELTQRIAFWLDLKNPYITYEASYIETVWRIIKSFWQSKLIYRGHKVVPYCSRCGTGLSSHEVAQGYKKIKEKAIFLKFKVVSLKPGFKNVSILSWTTTPWTLPGNVALAVNPKLKYLKARAGKETFVLAKEKLTLLEDRNYKVLGEMKGEELVGLKYKPLFNVPRLKSAKSYQVYPASFVTSKEGTGVVHTAVMYGEDDYDLGKKIGLPTFHTVNQEGKFIKGLGSGLAGLYVKSEKAEQRILEHLKKNNFFLKEELYEHDYPFCWRCSSPLLYYAKESWLVNMQKVKKELIEGNKKINWTPSHLREGRFGEWLKEVKDWVISRERYWGTPLPIWQCKKCQNLEVIGSREDLISQKSSKNKYFILRHGHSLRNEKDLVVNWPEKIYCPLTEKGKKEIEKAGQKIKKENIDLIFSSDLLRAKQTSEILGKELGLKPKLDKRLREIDMGELNGKKVKEAARFWDPQKKLSSFDYSLKKFKTRAPGGENYLDVKKRVCRFLEGLEKKYQNKTILIVSHELPLSMLEASTMALLLEEIIEFRKKRQIKTGQLRQIEFRSLPYNQAGELDFHRPYLDRVKFYCPKCSAKDKKGERGLMERRPEVLDVWLDSGSMPFAQNYRSFGFSEAGAKKKFLPGKEKGEKMRPPALFPADYISEAIDQTRGWFYTLHAVSTLLGFGPSYKNVISLGHVLDEKGEKMSKSKGNVVNPWDVINKYGVDAIRWYFFTVNQPGDSKLFSEKDVEQTLKKFVLTFWNCFQFFQTYRGSSKQKNKSAKQKLKAKNILDRWIISRLNELIQETTAKLDNYDVTGAGRAIENFVVNDFSLWYIRRSRKRFKGAEPFLAFVLEVLSKLTAPFLPFLSEEIYREVSGKKRASVHLADWPKADKKLIDKNLNKKMEKAREIVAKAFSERAKAGIKVRQPLSKLQIADYKLEKERELLALIKDEVNIKEIVFGKTMKLDTKITPELKEKGMVREFIRQIQEMRKKAGLKPQDRVLVSCQGSKSLNQVLAKNKSFVLKEARVKNLVFARKERQACLAKKEIEIEGQKLLLTIKKA